MSRVPVTGSRVKVNPLLNPRDPAAPVTSESFPSPASARAAAAGAVLWFTGLPSSGKSTIARAVLNRLLDRGLLVELLDGAEVRESLSRGLSFSREDREEHIRRMGYVAKLLSRNGVITICAAVSPYRATRDEVRRNTTNFVEIYVECPLPVAEERDTDGWYARARRGEVDDFTGVNAPYEAPINPEVHIQSAVESVDDAAENVLSRLEDLQLISRLDDERRRNEMRKRLGALGYL
jgi:adenylyl-sulfate kinase